MPPTSGRSEAILERLHALHPKLIDLSLDRMHRALAALDHPERRLPPVIHVAGTNGKGSTCAFLRAIAEAAGQRVHVFTSPHLVRFHERIRLAGALVGEAMLAEAFEEAERVNAGLPITVFEITTAAAFHLFARVPADLLVLEVGLGGLYDATNVVDRPAATAIASISMDHMDFLGDRIAGIAREKAGIIKPGVPCASVRQPAEAATVIFETARAAAAPLLMEGEAWHVAPTASGFRYQDAAGALALPPPALLGPHQVGNAGLAIAALRAWNPDWLTGDAIARGVVAAEWPARLQRLTGRLAASLPPVVELWLDGGHNAGGGAALAAQLALWRAAPDAKPIHLIVGMKGSKVVEDFLRPLLRHAATLWAVTEPGQHLATPPERIVEASGGLARIGPRIADALAGLPPGPARVLICGSLYLAGEVLKMDAL